MEKEERYRIIFRGGTSEKSTPSSSGREIFSEKNLGDLSKTLQDLH